MTFSVSTVHGLGLPLVQEVRGVIRVCDQLRQFLVHEKVRVRDTQLLARAESTGIPVTFDADVAFRKPRIEFINVVHPLVRAIAHHYGENADCSCHAYEYIGDEYARSRELLFFLCSS